MPRLEQNIQVWNSSYDWANNGEEWSEAWGNSEAQWFGSIYPRIHSFLPCETILEIAPGFGRWTKFLRRYCKRLLIVDLSDRCIDACRQRFHNDSHIEYFVNDGKSLGMIPQHSIDFVFSFDSLVHVESDSIESYVLQLKEKLKPNGGGFIHHSNLGMFEAYFHRVELIPAPIRSQLGRVGLVDDSRWRAMSLTAEKFRKFCDSAQIDCVSQELINWRCSRLIDCFSTFANRSSLEPVTPQVVRNYDFMKEAELIRNLASIYTVADAE